MVCHKFGKAELQAGNTFPTHFPMISSHWMFIFHGAALDAVPGVASWFTFMGTGGVSRIEGVLKSLVRMPEVVDLGVPRD